MFVKRIVRKTENKFQDHVVVGVFDDSQFSEYLLLCFPRDSVGDHNDTLKANAISYLEFANRVGSNSDLECRNQVILNQALDLKFM